MIYVYIHIAERGLWNCLVPEPVGDELSLKVRILVYVVEEGSIRFSNLVSGRAIERFSNLVIVGVR